MNNEGYALTNRHVIQNCVVIILRVNGERQEAAIAAVDEANDLALLKVTKANSDSGFFRNSRRVFLGEPVAVSGYLLSGLLAEGLNFTTGTVSATIGVGNDARLLQITAPVQPGNSGGPLLDKSGNVMGVVVAKLDAVKVFKATGDIPQNVNFAVKGVVARGFLDIHGIDYKTADSTNAVDTTIIASKARQFTVPVECWK